MNWKIKATAQNIIDMLPSFLAYPAYASIQRTFGALRVFQATSPIIVSSHIVKSLKENGGDIVDRTVLEVGTGSRLDVPIGLWLSGASRVVTVDLNPILKKDLVRKYINYVKCNRKLIEQTCPDVVDSSYVRRRYDLLMSEGKDIDSLLALMNIEYLAPADAARLSSIGDHSIDVHFWIAFVSCVYFKLYIH